MVQRFASQQKRGGVAEEEGRGGEACRAVPRPSPTQEAPAASCRPARLQGICAARGGGGGGRFSGNSELSGREVRQSLPAGISLFPAAINLLLISLPKPNNWEGEGGLRGRWASWPGIGGWAKILDRTLENCFSGTGWWIRRGVTQNSRFPGPAFLLAV